MERPAIVSAFGILNIVFAVGRLGKALLFVHTYAFARAHDPGFGIRMREHALYAFWYDWFIPLTLVSFGILLVSGIGLLKLQEWARKLAIIYAIFATLTGAGFALTRFVYFVVPTVEKSMGSHGMWSNLSATTALLSAIASVVQLAYPILLLIFMTRPGITAVFRPGVPPVLPQA